MSNDRVKIVVFWNKVLRNIWSYGRWWETGCVFDRELSLLVLYVYFSSSVAGAIYLRLEGRRVGHAVAQLVETLRYKPEGRGFGSRWCHWDFSLTSFRPHYGPGVDSASNRNEYQVYFLGVRKAYNLTTFMCQLSWNLGASNFWNPQGPSRPVMGLLYLRT
jgi:hypothetical protein